MSKVSSHTAQLAVALAAGIAVYLLTCLVEPPQQGPIVWGIEWAKMSLQPFGFVGPFPHRLLSPLLAHMVGLDGDYYAWFSIVLSVFLLAVVFYFCQQRGLNWVDALLVTSAVGFSGAVQTFKTLVGYSDNLTYALLLIGMLVARNGWAFWAVYFANLCNHELAFFFLPWLLFVRRQAGASLRSDVLGLAITAGLYIAFRLFVAQQAEAQTFTTEYFARNNFLPWGTLALLVLTAVHLLAAFGPLLIVLFWHAGAPHQGLERLHSLLIAAGILSIFAVAYDVVRHTNFMFLPLVIASARFLGSIRASRIYALVLASSIASYLLLGPPVLAGISEIIAECEAYPDYSRLVTCVLPRIWDQLLGCGIGIVALALFAHWLRRSGIGSTAP